MFQSLYDVHALIELGFPKHSFVQFFSKHFSTRTKFHLKYDLMTFLKLLRSACMSIRLNRLFVMQDIFYCIQRDNNQNFIAILLTICVFFFSFLFLYINKWHEMEISDCIWKELIDRVTAKQPTFKRW